MWPKQVGEYMWRWCAADVWDVIQVKQTVNINH